MMRFIGDVHGKISNYERKLGGTDYSLQLGDMGLGFRGVDLPPIYADNHKFIYGNHDNPDLCKCHPACLGDFGVWRDIFYVSGAGSVDAAFRTPGFDLWDTELKGERWAEVEGLYLKTKPEAVVTHECPLEIADRIHGVRDEATIKDVRLRYGWDVRPSLTQHMLQRLFQQHQPKLWVFGHHHRNWTEEVEGTTFACLNELTCFDVPEE